MSTTALVLAGGGLSGIGWEIGILAGLERLGIDLTNADIVVGTSAGSIVGAGICSGPVQEGYQRALVPAPPGSEEFANHGSFDFAAREFVRSLPAMVGGGSPSAHLKRIGAAARRARPHGGPERVELIRQAVPPDGWPERDLRITATNIDTGRVEVLTKHGPADLVHAVAASCAAPFFWPAVRIGDHDYVDGGMLSVANIAVAAEADVVVVLAPMPYRVPGSRLTLKKELKSLRGDTLSLLVSPTRRNQRLIMRNFMAPWSRSPAARAGYADAYEWAGRVAAIWPS